MLTMEADGVLVVMASPKSDMDEPGGTVTFLILMYRVVDWPTSDFVVPS